MSDPVFNEEQQHLTQTYAKLTAIAQSTAKRLKARLGEGLTDRENMLDELTLDLGNDVDTETYVEIEAVHKIIDAYNLSNDMDTERLNSAHQLLNQPYFAKVTLDFKKGGANRDIYIGSTGIADDDRRRFIVDWRSPVAEVYYNQSNGATSYEANGRTIECDLQLRRQFDIQRDKLNAYFDTTVAIEDPLLLASLSKQRSAKLKDITTTIQKEQNLVIRHKDVPALLVNGIAGSGKTSVLLQRIAYLLYQERDNLNPSDVYLITPNKVFEHYISDVLPNMGEKNPQTMTWAEFADKLGAGNRGLGKDPSAQSLERIDEILSETQLDAADFQDLCVEEERIISAGQARSAFNKYAQFPTGAKRSSLAIEDLLERLSQRIARLSKDEDTQAIITEMTPEEQIATFGQYVTADSEEEIIAATRTYLEKRYAPIGAAIENGEWLRIERIGMRMLGKESLTSAEWVYLKLALAGGANEVARYVMIDEVQDYSAAQLMALARYFSHAHFLLLGDENQAIREGCASFTQIQELFAKMKGNVEVCQLMTSYRSSPEITELFARLAPDQTRLQVNSVQPSGNAPIIKALGSEDEYVAALREAAKAAIENTSQGGLAAIIVADKRHFKWMARNLENLDVTIIGTGSHLPPKGVALMDLSLAKGLEFDEVIVADANKKTYGADTLSRHRLYTAMSRGTQRLTLLAQGELTPLLQQ